MKIKSSTIIFQFDIAHFFTKLFNIYLIILILDPMRESVDLGELNTILTVIREMTIVLLVLIVIFFKRKLIIPYFVFFYFVILLIVGCISVFSTLGLGTNIKGFYGFLRSLAVCFVISNLPELYQESPKKLIKRYICVVIFCFLLSMVLYFLFPKLLINAFFKNRLSVGNPSMQSICYISAFALTFYFSPFNRILNILFSVILLLATVSTVTSTAFVALAVIFVISMFNPKLFKNWVPIVLMFTLSAYLVIIFSNYDFDYLLGTISYKMDELVQLLHKFFGENYNVDKQSQSFNNRTIQIENFWKNVSPMDLFFGDGNWSMSDLNHLLIENTYFGVIRDFGMIGGIFYFFIIISGFIYGFYQCFKKRDLALLIFFAILAVYSVTLHIFVSTSMTVQFFLLFYLLNTQSKGFYGRKYIVCNQRFIYA